MRIAVLGGGNGSYAAAADLAEQGHEVRFWRRDAGEFAPVLATGAITLEDFRGSRVVPLALVTTDLAVALDGAELVVAPIPAVGQLGLAETLAPHLVDGQVVFLPPGTFGSYVMPRRMAELGSTARVGFAEAGTLPYLARKHGPGTIAITTRATRLPSGAFPYADAEHIFAVLGQAYPAVERLTDALDGALMNAGPIIHPPLIILNAGPIQHFEHWDIHNEGTQPMIRAVTDALDAERIAVREALGYGAPHFPLKNHYDDDAEEWMYGNAAHERLTDSGDWRETLDLAQHRYMREDVAMGLAFLASVGDWVGVATPVATGLVAIASAMVGEDLRRGPRTIEGLGLADQTPAALQAVLRAGFGS
jgi:opine dehydrogenase